VKKENFMCLSEEKRAQLQKCIENHQSILGSILEKIKFLISKGFMIKRGVGNFPRFYLRPWMGKKFLRRFLIEKV